MIPEGTTPPGYETTQFSGSIGGPLTKKASFFFNFERRDINDLSIVSATILDPNFNIINFSDAVANPRVRTNLSPRFDYQISKNNTLTARYQYEHNRQDNQGIGLFDLASNGYNSLETEQTLQVSDTQILTPKIINETRFQFIRETTNQSPLITAPTVSVQQAFTDGGSSQGTLHDILDRYEFQNYTSMALGKTFPEIRSATARQPRRQHGDLRLQRQAFPLDHGKIHPAQVAARARARSSAGCRRTRLCNRGWRMGFRSRKFPRWAEEPASIRSPPGAQVRTSPISTPAFTYRTIFTCGRT